MTTKRRKEKKKKRKKIKESLDLLDDKIIKGDVLDKEIGDDK